MFLASSELQAKNKWTKNTRGIPDSDKGSPEIWRFEDGSGEREEGAWMIGKLFIWNALLVLF